VDFPRVRSNCPRKRGKSNRHRKTPLDASHAASGAARARASAHDSLARIVELAYHRTRSRRQREEASAPLVRSRTGHNPGLDERLVGERGGKSPTCWSMFRASVAGAAIASLLLAGCSASLQVGGGVRRNTTTPPQGVGNGLRQGEWLARGVVLSSRGGGAITGGEVLNRIWFFQRQCAHGRCAIYWTRPIDTGVFTAELTNGLGAEYSARFQDESAPCTRGTSEVVRAFGLLTSVFTVHLGPGTDHMSASEHTYATTAACSAVDHIIRWTATRVASGATTQSPPGARS
jgi:hypothetical protein